MRAGADAEVERTPRTFGAAGAAPFSFGVGTAQSVTRVGRGRAAAGAAGAGSRVSDAPAEGREGRSRTTVQRPRTAVATRSSLNSRRMKQPPMLENNGRLCRRNFNMGRPVRDARHRENPTELFSPPLRPVQS